MQKLAFVNLIKLLSFRVETLKTADYFANKN